MSISARVKSTIFSARSIPFFVGLLAFSCGSCSFYGPPEPMMGDPAFQSPPPQRNRFGHNGYDSPNEHENPSPNRNMRNERQNPPRPVPRIKRDPRNTTVDVTPPKKNDRERPENTPPDATEKPVEEPVETVKDKPSEPKPAKPSTKEDLQYGVPVVGKPGFVYSPHAPSKGYVDVEGLSRGTRVKCPYTGQHFRVP